MDLGLIVKSIFFNKYLVGILGIVCTYLFLDNSEKIFAFVKRWIKGVVNFFKNKLFLLIVIIFVAIYYIIGYIRYVNGQPTFSLSSVCAISISFVLTVLLFCRRDILHYLEKRYNLPSVVVWIISNLNLFIHPIWCYCILYRLSEIYLENFLVDMFVVILYVFMAIDCCYLIFVDCLELLIIKQDKYSQKNKAFHFFCNIVCIIQTFALIYTLILVIDHNAFKNVVTDSAFSIAFDMTYFSAMTLLTGNNVIEPHSTIAKAVVLVETFILTVYISIIIFGIIEGQKKED